MTRVPGFSEVERIAEDFPMFETNDTILTRQDWKSLTRNDPSGNTSATPTYFDYYGMNKIFLYPQLVSTASTAQRTLTYYVYRRPHEVFYDVDRAIDLPIICKRALIQGVKWKRYSFSSRSGEIEQRTLYEQFKNEITNRVSRSPGKRFSIVDVNGDVFGNAL